NPRAIGAVVRLKFDGQWGAATELHAGGGYWSQDSTAIVLATPAAPTALRARWPGGKIQEWAWPAGAKNVQASAGGITAQP
ncbi:MAG TPA: ASPIC/UnbV domain-containing protein, partial [Verrucomicrobiae bacterium]|nr:ASPIC/UnbV domain-containing protein [Verrucomicrobiae bacterium]